MRDPMSSPYNADNSDWHLKPQASYPAQPEPYNPPQQVPGYQHLEGMPQQPVPYHNAYPGYPVPPVYPAPGYPAPPVYPAPGYPVQQQVPQYQMPYSQMPQGVNINIINTQNAFAQELYDPYSGQARTARTMGIVAILIWIVPFVGSLTSLICAIIGVINGIQGLKSTTRHGSAVTGLILSGITLALMVGGIIIFGATLLTLLGMHHTAPMSTP